MFTCAARGSSELLARRWGDIRFHEHRIRVSRRWTQGKDVLTNTKASDSFVPRHPRLARHLRAWKHRTPDGREPILWFPSLKASGRAPLSASILLVDHPRKAALAVGVPIRTGTDIGSMT